MLRADSTSLGGVNANVNGSDGPWTELRKHVVVLREVQDPQNNIGYIQKYTFEKVATSSWTSFWASQYL
jgi:hypothetical protein